MSTRRPDVRNKLCILLLPAQFTNCAHLNHSYSANLHHKPNWHTLRKVTKTREQHQAGKMCQHLETILIQKQQR